MDLPTPRISLPFNGDFLDTSVNNNDVTPSGIILKSDTPKIGSGYAFGDGINDDGEIADSPSLDADYVTFANWVRHTTSGTKIVYERSSGSFGPNDYDLLTVGGKLLCQLHIGGSNRQVQSPLVYNDGNWHLVIWSYDGVFLRLFIDNIYVAELAVAHGPIGASSDPLTLFARKGKIIPFPGSMDSFLMFGEALSFGGVSLGQQATGQVAEIWNSGAGIEVIVVDGKIIFRRRMEGYQMSKVILRKYGVATTIPFSLFEIDGIDFKTDAVYVAGDVKLMKDEGAEGNVSSGFTDEGQGYSQPLSAAEMEHARGKLYIVDQGTKAWLDTGITIETYGHASAQHPNIGWPFALEANVELHVSNAINNTIPLYERTDGTLTADGTEQIIYEVTPTVTLVPDSITMSLINMAADDRLTINMYAKLKSGGVYELIDTQDYGDAKDIPAINITGQPNRYGWKVTLQQTAGINRDYDWERYTLTT